ncbi:hypothetical protein A0O34_04910 [Chryseobacterium glaciei]|uniref:Uncharacterized protein n=2 Tax=Chryseobacterium glaciei TaxID=1685010 RepID=A0A172XSC0_9FLAO|nr:hypothetical protein A0O34_04910 [Chryseobacterium glaciei]
MPLYIFSSCKGQDKEEKQKPEVYKAKCEGEYSTGQKTTEREKKWSLTKSDILSIISLSKEIDAQEVHYTYPVTPCNIDVKGFNIKGKKVDLFINGGSHLQITDGSKITILGCDDPKCKKYFLFPKEDMNDEAESVNDSNYKVKNTYKVDFDNDKISDSIIIKQNTEEQQEFKMEIYKNGNLFFNKLFYCDSMLLDLQVNYGQIFNIKIENKDQYGNVFGKVTIPVLLKNKELYVEKLFVANFGISAKTGDNEWNTKEFSNKTKLKNLNLDNIYRGDDDWDYE